MWFRPSDSSAHLVSSSKFKLVCQVVNAKKPKKSRVTHLQLKGVMKFYYWHEKTISFKTSYLCWIIVSYYAKVHCLQKKIMCQLIIKISQFPCVLWSNPENLLVQCYCYCCGGVQLKMQIRADQSEALKPEQCQPIRSSKTETTLSAVTPSYTKPPNTSYFS